MRGETTTVEGLGDPFIADSYAFCIHDASANPHPLISAAVPASGSCGPLRCWTTLSGSRIDYPDRERVVGGIELIRMKPGHERLAGALVRARTEDFMLPDTPLRPSVTVQLQVANGRCWTAEYAVFIGRNEGGVFKAQPGS